MTLTWWHLFRVRGGEHCNRGRNNSADYDENWVKAFKIVIKEWTSHSISLCYDISFEAAKFAYAIIVLHTVNVYRLRQTPDAGGWLCLKLKKSECIPNLKFLIQIPTEPFCCRLQKLYRFHVLAHKNELGCSQRQVCFIDIHKHNWKRK